MQIYLVGGAVRDGLLGRPVTDKDFVVVGASIDEMLAANFLQVGADFPVFLHPKTQNEYALARTERKTGTGYQGFHVHASPDVTLEQDLQRRDLTINAMAIEVTSLDDDTPITGEIIDYYGGLGDIESKTLRHVSDAFSEDPLRVLRVARFYSRYYDLGFGIADETLGLMRDISLSGELSDLSGERIWQESSRAMMQRSPHVYWQTLFDIEAMTDYFAPIHRAWQNVSTKETAQTALYFAGQMALNLSQRWALLMASLYHSDNAVPAALQHTDAIGRAAKVPKAHTGFAKTFIQHHALLSQISTLSAADKIDAIQSIGAHKDASKLSQLLITSHVWQLATDHRDMMVALSSFHDISIKDIDHSLTGAAIGQALRKARITHLQHRLCETDCDDS